MRTIAAIVAATLLGGCMSPGFNAREAEIDRSIRENTRAMERISAWYATDPYGYLRTYPAPVYYPVPTAIVVPGRARATTYYLY